MEITNCKITSQTGKDFIFFNSGDSDIFQIELTFISAYQTISEIKIQQGGNGEATISTSYRNGIYTAKSGNLNFRNFFWDYLYIFGEFFSFQVIALDSAGNEIDYCNYNTNFRIYSSRDIVYDINNSNLQLINSIPFWDYFSENNESNYSDCYIESAYSFSKIYSRLDYYPYLVLNDTTGDMYIGADSTPMGGKELIGNSSINLIIFKGDEEDNNIFYENIDNSPNSIFSSVKINFPDPEEGISQKYIIKFIINLEEEVVKTFTQEVLVYLRPEPEITLNIERFALINNEYKQSSDGEILSFTGNINFNNNKNIPLQFENFKIELIKKEVITKNYKEEEIVRAYNIFKKNELNTNFSENFSFMDDAFLYEKTKSFNLKILITDGFYNYLIEKKVFPTYNPILQLEKNYILLNSAENKINEKNILPNLNWEKEKYYQKDDICFYKGDYYLLLQDTFFQGSIESPDKDPLTYQKITLDQTDPFLINGSSASYHFGVSYLEKTNFTSAWATPALNSALFTQLEIDTTSLKIRGNLDGFFEIQGSFKIGGAASSVERKIFSLPIIATPFKSMNFLVSTDKIGYLASLRIDSNGYLILERIFSGTTIYTNSTKIKINCNINYSTYPLVKRKMPFIDYFWGNPIEDSIGQIIDYPNNDTILEEDNPNIISASSFQENYEPYRILIPYTTIARFGNINSWKSLETDLLPTLIIKFPYPGTFSFDSLALDVFEAKKAIIYLDGSKVAEINLEEDIFDFKNNYAFSFQEEIKIEFIKTEENAAVEVSNFSVNKIYRDAGYFLGDFYSWDNSFSPFDYFRIIPKRKEEFFEESYIEKINNIDYLGLWQLIIPETN